MVCFSVPADSVEGKAATTPAAAGRHLHQAGAAGEGLLLLLVGSIHHLWFGRPTLYQMSYTRIFI